MAQKSDSIAGGVAVLIYIVALTLAFFFVKMSTESEFEMIRQSSGVLVNFGNENAGFGDVISVDETVKKNEIEVKPEVAPQPIVDDKAPDAQVKAVEKQVEAPVEKAITKPEVEDPVVNRGALYKKKTGSTESTTDQTVSHGMNEGRAGKSGQRDGEVDVAGGGGTGSDFALKDRTLVGELAKPEYNDRVEGRIVVEIQVNRDGKVQSATYMPAQSTISSGAVIEAVRQAAFKTRFNSDKDASYIQIGTITYILKIE